MSINRIDRLFAITLLLQARRRIRAQDLARVFEVTERVICSEVPLMTAMTGFDDRNMVNQCLMYCYIISYEPYNFKGRLSDYPLTVAYGSADGRPAR